MLSFISIIEFAKSDDSIGEMSLLWRKKYGEPCPECNDQSIEKDFNCYLCGKVCLLLFVKRQNLCLEGARELFVSLKSKGVERHLT